MDPRRALELAEGSRTELLQLLGELIEAPSPYGSSAREAQARLGEYLGRNGFAVETGEDSWEPLRDHPEFSPPPPEVEPPVNLVATPSCAPGLIFFAHVDTEAPAAGWSSPPTEATVRDGRVHGLGAADDKGGLAAAAVAAALLARDSGTAPRVVSVHGKGGGARGTLPVFARMEAGDSLYVHPPENGAGLGVLKSASRGVVDVTFGSPAGPDGPGKSGLRRARRSRRVATRWMRASAGSSACAGTNSPTARSTSGAWSPARPPG